jgi:putative ABC transport system permease protein
MVLRNLERRPFRAALSILGLSLAVGILVLGNFVQDTIDFVVDNQFYTAQRQDLLVTFVEPSDDRAIHACQNLPGVRSAEPFRALACRISNGSRSRRLSVMGIRPSAQLFRAVDMQGRPIDLPQEGVVLSEKLAAILDVTSGDEVDVHLLEGRRQIRRLTVRGTVRDFAGLSAWMDHDAANRLAEEGNVSSGAALSAENHALVKLNQQLKETPRIAGVTVKQAAIDAFRDIVGGNLLRMKLFNVAFAVIIAFGVVYNSARISLSERARELASLRVLGFTRGEVSAILLGELGVLTALAMPLGLALGYGYVALSVLALDTETHRFPLIIRPATYAFAVVVPALAALASGLVVRRRIRRLDLVAVLKSRE